MSSDIAVSVRGLSKAYNIVHNAEQHVTLAEAMLARVKHPFRRMERETFWALKDVNFDIRRGDVVGIIGRNGAGKSTLLKVLSRITEPTQGQIDIYGRIGSLLEVGTGFHPELTGRENIYLNGAILGMRRREITRQFDAIVDFAGVEKFLDTPVKRYSSGMYVRLAFAVAAHLNPEILIVDEVLAVGDAEFQKKCLGKMKDVSTQEGRTVLFVSHNMAAVQSLCNRGILLKDGQTASDAPVTETINRYIDSATPTGFKGETGVFDLRERKNAYNSNLFVQGLRLLDSARNPTETIPMGSGLIVEIALEGYTDIPGPQCAVIFKDKTDKWLANFNTGMRPPLKTVEQGLVKCILELPVVPFVPGIYWLDISIAQKGIGRVDYVDRAASLEIIDADIYNSGYAPGTNDGLVFLDGHWVMEPLVPDGVHSSQ